MAQEATNKQIAVIERDVSDKVMKRVRELESGHGLLLPAGYSPENALKSGFLLLRQTVNKDGVPALQVCTNDSVTMTFLDIVLQGLNPSKSQCYLIVRGDKLTLLRSYFGTERALRTVMPEVDLVPCQVIYEGDTIEYDIGAFGAKPTLVGQKIITKHTQSFANMNNHIIGVYGYIIKSDGELIASDMMTSNEVFASWKQSTTGVFLPDGTLNPKSTHARFPVEMTKKTLLSRMCKRPLKTTDDSAMIAQREAFLRTTENEFEDDINGDFEESKPQVALGSKNEPKPETAPVTKQTQEPHEPAIEKHVQDGIEALFGDGQPF